MQPLVVKRYQCTNVERCSFARADRVFEESEHADSDGYCPLEEGGCGKKLTGTKSRDNRLPVAVLVMLFLGMIVWLVPKISNWLFPPPLQNIAFETDFTEISESDRIVHVGVVRSGELSSPLIVHFATVPGSAIAEVDYATTEGALTFESGERQHTISVNILPDTDILESPEDFSLHLFNVAGNPQHQIIIGTTQSEKQLYDAVLSEVRALSAVSIDIGKLHVKIEVITRIIEAGVDLDADVQKIYFRKYEELKDNHQRALRRYIEHFRALSEHDGVSVFTAFENWIVRLENEQQLQQAAATAIAREQLRIYLENGEYLEESWAQELGSPDVIPRAQDEAENLAKALEEI